MEAQTIVIKTNIAAVKEPSSAHKGCDDREPLVSAPQLVHNQIDASPAVSEISSSHFPSSTSSVTKGGDEYEYIEEGVNEELSDSIIVLESLNLSKEVDKLLLINEAIDDVVSESDDSLYSMFSEESHQND
eukprot:gene9253-10042_t